MRGLTLGSKEWNLVQVGLTRVADTSWVTPVPANPLNVGQYVNNGGREANVAYTELTLPTNFPLRLRKLLPNVNFAGSGEGGERGLRVVALVAVREVVQGEELLSSYFTLVNRAT